MINRMFNTHHILTEKELFSLLHERRISYRFSNIKLLQLKSSRKKNNSSSLPESSLSLSLC